MNAEQLQPAVPEAAATMPWIVFVAAVGIAVAFIAFAGLPDHEAPVRPRRTSTAPEFAKALASSKDWQRAAAIFVDRLQGEAPERWDGPPAGGRVPPDVLASQNRASSDPPPVVRLTFYRLDSGPAISEKSSDLELGAAGQTFTVKLNYPIIDLAIPPEAGAISIRLCTSSFIGFVRNCSTEVSVPRRLMLAGGNIDMSVASSAEQEKQSLPFGIGAEVLPRIDRASAKAVARSPKELQSATGLDKALEQSGELGLLSPDADFVIDNMDRYVAVLVVSNMALRDRVRCFRLDTGQQIGTYNPTIPMLAAIANNRTPLLLRIAGGLRGQFSFRVFAVTRDTEPGADLALWFLGGHLMKTKFGGLPVSNEQAQAIAAWLAEAFRVRFTSEELERVQDPIARAVARTMVQSLPPSATSSPR